MAGGRTDAGGVLLDAPPLSVAPATAAGKAGLDQPFSLYLDLVRIAAACTVVLPLLPAFALAAFADSLGMPVSDAYRLRKPWLYIPFHLLFLGEPWGFVESPPWLLPYWSLNYEAWYYVLFDVLCYLKGRLRLLALAVFALMGPRLWLLLPLWLPGAFLYRWQKTHGFPRGTARAGWALSLVLLGLWAWYYPEPGLRRVAQSLWPRPGVRMGSADRVLADYAVGLLVLMNFACARRAGDRAGGRGAAAAHRSPATAAAALSANQRR